jgi:aryl-alcohol dehydrogenase-like predicted oxidoreductase
MERYTMSLARVACEEYVQIAAKHGLTPTQLALAWCRSRWFVTSTIIGATSMEQLRENLGAFGLSLSQEAIDDINAVYRRMRDPPTAA